MARVLSYYHARLQANHGSLSIMKRKRIPYGTKLPVRFTLPERELIREHTLCPDFADLALADGNGIRLDLSLDEIEELQGYVAAEANHTDDKKIQGKLDAVFDKLEKFLDSYDDQWESDSEQPAP